MTSEIKPARKRINANDMIHVSHNTSQRATHAFAKWEPPAKFLRESPREHRNIPFAEDKDYIKADKFDRWVAISLSFGVGVWLFVTASEMWGIQ